MQTPDFFIRTHQMLLKGQRSKEVIELCEYAVSSVLWPKAVEYQAQALWRFSLANAYMSIGDARKARDTFSSLLCYVDCNVVMSTLSPESRLYIEDIYVTACAHMGQLAISYDEYFAFLRKMESIRPLTEGRRNVMERMEQSRMESKPWYDAILTLAVSTIRESETNTGCLATAMALYALLLIFPEIDPPLNNLCFAIREYGVCVCKLISEYIRNCDEMKHPANPDNYRFIFDEAIDLVSEFLNDMETKGAAEDARNRLIQGRRTMIDKLPFHDCGYASIAPTDAPNYIPPLIIKEQMKRHATNPMSAKMPTPGCLAALAIRILSLGGMIAAGVMIRSFF